MTPPHGCSDPSWPCLQPVRPAVRFAHSQALAPSVPPCQGCWVWPLALDLALVLVLVLAVGFGCRFHQHAKRKPQTNHLQSSHPLGSHLSVIQWWWWQVATRSSRASHLCTRLPLLRQGWQGKAWWGGFRNCQLDLPFPHPASKASQPPLAAPARPLRLLTGVSTANSQQPAPQGQGTNSLSKRMGIILNPLGRTRPVSACSIR